MGLKGFNLLQDHTQPPDLWDKIYDWITKVGRVIVIVIELIVILSFGARIVIDTQTKALQEEVEQNAAVLDSLKSAEADFRDKQARFGSYREIWNNSSTYQDIIDSALDEIPTQIEGLNIRASGQTLSIQGTGANSNIERLENGLRNMEQLEEVRVAELVAEDLAGTGGNTSSFNITTLIREDLILGRSPIDRENAAPLTSAVNNQDGQ